MSDTRRWDIFCTVVDNFGDIGITWRLARQLAAEQALAVRLWVDDLASFARIRPEIDPGRATQLLRGVEVRHWSSPLPTIVPSDVVVEALACHLPASFELAMAERRPAPLWINLEYLSAEDWVAGCHGLPSPHPRLPLTKYFFMPGYVAGTGGVLKEAWLDQERDRFQADRDARDAFWASLGVPAEGGGEVRVSLFSYENPAIAALLAGWRDSAAPLRCLLPVGKNLEQVAHALGVPSLSPGQIVNSGRLTLHVLPMLDQDRYDRLLWACDVNFVRGEDSFVRGQWAGKPLVWQAYPQEEGAHWPKIEAFMDLYCADLDPATARALRELWRCWNGGGDAGQDVAAGWVAFLTHSSRLRAHAVHWMKRLDGIGDLAGNLLRFTSEKRAALTAAG